MHCFTVCQYKLYIRAYIRAGLRRGLTCIWKVGKCARTQNYRLRQQEHAQPFDRGALRSTGSPSAYRGAIVELPPSWPADDPRRQRCSSDYCVRRELRGPKADDPRKIVSDPT